MKSMDDAKPKTKPEPALAPASETCDAAVHRLLAVRANRTAIGDESGVAEATAALAKLGYR